MGLIVHANFEDVPLDVGQRYDFREWGTQCVALDPGGPEWAPDGESTWTQQDVLWNTDEAARTGTKCGFAIRNETHPLWKIDDPTKTPSRRSEFSPTHNTMRDWSGLNDLIWGSGDCAGLSSGGKPVRWYGMSYYLPPDWYQGDSGGFNDRVIIQFASSFSPLWAIRINGARTRFNLTYKTPESTPASITPAWVAIDLGLQTWVDFVWRFKWSLENDGEVEWFVNGTSIWSDTRQTIFSAGGTYQKFGTYGQPTKVFFDEFRIGDQDSSLQEMTPGSPPQPPSAALSGTITPSVTETEIKAGGKTLIIKLTNAEWINAYRNPCRITHPLVTPAWRARRSGLYTLRDHHACGVLAGRSLS